MLTWTFDGISEWEADSRVTWCGIPCQWVVSVCEDGTFSVDQSGTELFQDGKVHRGTFPTLVTAKAFCERAEEQLRINLECDAVFEEEKRNR